MKSKQLANVLIKMLGLSFGLRAASGILFLILSRITQINNRGFPNLDSAIGDVVQIFLGFLLITKSRCVAEWILKGEEE